MSKVNAKRIKGTKRSSHIKSAGNAKPQNSYLSASVTSPVDFKKNTPNSYTAYDNELAVDNLENEQDTTYADSQDM